MGYEFQSVFYVPSYVVLSFTYRKIELWWRWFQGLEVVEQACRREEFCSTGRRTKNCILDPVRLRINQSVPSSMINEVPE